MTQRVWFPLINILLFYSRFRAIYAFDDAAINATAGPGPRQPSHSLSISAKIRWESQNKLLQVSEVRKVLQNQVQLETTREKGVRRRSAISLRQVWIQNEVQVNMRKRWARVETRNSRNSLESTARLIEGFHEIHFLCFYLTYSHNLRSHQKIRHAEYQGEGVTITTVRKSRSTANAQQTPFNASSHSQSTSSLIISPPPPPNILNLNASDMKPSLPMYKSDWNSKPRWGILGGDQFYCWC